MKKEEFPFPLTQNGKFIMVGEHFIENYDNIDLNDYLYPENINIDFKKEMFEKFKTIRKKLIFENVLSSEDLYLMNQGLINNYNNIVRLTKENCEDEIYREIVDNLKELRFKYDEIIRYIGKI